MNRNRILAIAAGIIAIVLAIIMLANMGRESRNEPGSFSINPDYEQPSPTIAKQTSTPNLVLTTTPEPTTPKSPTATPPPTKSVAIEETLTLEEHCTDQWMWLNSAGKYSNKDTLSEAEWLSEFEKINDRGMKTHDECGTIWDRLEKLPHETACYRDDVDEWMSDIEPVFDDLETAITLLGDMLTDAIASPRLMNDSNWRNNTFEQLSNVEDESEKLLWLYVPSVIANAHYSVEDAARAITTRASVLREAIAASDVTRLSAVMGLSFLEAADHFGAANASLEAYQMRCG